MTMAKRKKQLLLRLQRPVYALLRAITQPYLRLHYGFRAPARRLPDGPCLIYANHLTNMDQFMLMHAFPQQMYFVASEHLLRRGFGRPMALLMDPIIRQKGRTDADAALAILRRLRQGKHVCVFIEGERSYDGCTAQIAESAAHLAKLAGVTFVTYRLENAYFSGPRWARHVRRGPVSGDIRHIYSPQELAGLSRDALQQALCRDLWLDASAEQAARPAVYRGRRLAEYLETTLFLCPRCGRIGSLKSADDRFACSCGLALRYTEYGRLEAAEGGEPPFTTVRDWFAWQRGRVQELARAALLPGAPDAPLAADAGQRLYACSGFSRRLQGRGCFALYADRIVFTPERDGKAWTLPLHALDDFSCQGRQLLSFLSGGQLYELVSPYPRSAVKYQLLLRALRRAEGEKEV